MTNLFDSQIAPDAKQERPGMNAFTILRERCGLSLQEAATVLVVRLDTVKSWSSGRRDVGDEVLDELRERYRDIVGAAVKLRQHILALVERHDPHEVAIGIATAGSDREAIRYGLRVAGAWNAAVGMAMLDSELDIKLPGLEIIVAEDARPMLVLIEKDPPANKFAQRGPWGGRRVLASQDAI